MFPENERSAREADPRRIGAAADDVRAVLDRLVETLPIDPEAQSLVRAEPCGG